MISLRASNSRGLGPAVYSSVRTRGGGDEGGPGGDDLDALDDGGDDGEGDGDGEGGEDEPAPLIPPVGVKVRPIIDIIFINLCIIFFFIG